MTRPEIIDRHWCAKCIAYTCLLIQPTGINFKLRRPRDCRNPKHVLHSRLVNITALLPEEDNEE